MNILLHGLLFLSFFPLIIFSMNNTVSSSNVISYPAIISITVLTYKPLYEITVSGHPAQNRKQITLMKLKRMLITPFEIPWVDFDNFELEKLREEYIKPLFKKLTNTYF